jgi:hypothetical protein
MTSNHVTIESSPSLVLTASRVLGMPVSGNAIHGCGIDQMKHFIKLHRAPWNPTTLTANEGLFVFRPRQRRLSSTMADHGCFPVSPFQSTGMSFCSPDHSNYTARNNDTFVDDTTECQRHSPIHTTSTTDSSCTLFNKSSLGAFPLRIWRPAELPKCFYPIV